MASPVISWTLQSSSASSSQSVVTHYNQLDMVTHQFFIKWWDKFNEGRIIEHVQKEFPTSLFPALMTSTVVPPIDILSPAPQNKAKASGNGNKSIKFKSSPTKFLDIKNVKKCSNSQLKMLVRALNERLNELWEDEGEGQEASSHNSPQSSGQDLSIAMILTIMKSSKMVKTHLLNWGVFSHYLDNNLSKKS